MSEKMFQFKIKNKNKKVYRVAAAERHNNQLSEEKMMRRRGRRLLADNEDGGLTNCFSMAGWKKGGVGGGW